LTIEKNSDIKHKGLRKFWEDGSTKGVQSDHANALRLILVHLDSAKSLNDIASGLGKIKRHHKLSGHDHRYAMEVNGNYRVTYDCSDSSTGVVTIIDYEDYH
jgi:proteic killer suppression protein